MSRLKCCGSIVAVHGLGGDWEQTWTDVESDRLWLRDFVPEQTQEVNPRISSFGYDSRTAFTNSVADIDDAAITLINALHDLRRLPNARKSTGPIIFVAHSLGGIIVKRVCLWRWQYPGLERALLMRILKAMNLANEQSERWKHVVDNVLGIIFFSVPHRGADDAYWASIVASVYHVATLRLRGNTNFIDALKRNSPQFSQISKAFIQPASRMFIIRTFYETAKIANKLVSHRFH